MLNIRQFSLKSVLYFCRALLTSVPLADRSKKLLMLIMAGRKRLLKNLMAIVKGKNSKTFKLFFWLKRHLAVDEHVEEHV